MTDDEELAKEADRKRDEYLREFLKQNLSIWASLRRGAGRESDRVEVELYIRNADGQRERIDGDSFEVERH
jgi:hypothetical protein